MIRITQYLRPHGEKRYLQVPDRAPEIEEKAKQIIDAGFKFEAEILTTGEVSLTITSAEADHAISTARNHFDPEHPQGPNAALDAMIRDFDIEEQLVHLRQLQEDE